MMNSIILLKGQNNKTGILSDHPPISASVFHSCLICYKCFPLAIPNSHLYSTNKYSISVSTNLNPNNSKTTQKHKKSTENQLKGVHAFF